MIYNYILQMHIMYILKITVQKLIKDSHVKKKRKTKKGI